MNKEKLINDIVLDCNTILSLANMVSMVYHQNIFGYKFGKPVLNQKVKRIISDCNDIKKELNSLVKVIVEKDHVEYELAYEQLRAFTWLSSCNIDQLRNYNDKIEKIPTILEIPTLTEI